MTKKQILRNWISISEIATTFKMQSNTIRTKLLKLRHLLPPDAISYMTITGKPSTKSIYLRRKYLNTFCELGGIRIYPHTTPDYLCATDIANILHTQRQNIFQLLKQYQSLMPTGAIEKQRSKTSITLFLHKDYLNMFCEMAGLLYTKPKTSEWLNSREIAKTLHIKHNNIHNLLQQMHQGHILPESALQKRLNGKSIVLCLHQDYLPVFIEKSGLTIVPQKDNTWLSPEDIRQKFGQKLDNMPTVLRTIRDQMPTGAIEFRKSGPKTFLCLNQDYIDEFSALTGIRKYEIKDDEHWIGARELEALLHINAPQIPTLFKEMQSKMPSGAIEYKKRGPRITLYLHRDFIAEFIVKSGLCDIRPVLKKLPIMQKTI